MSCLISEESDVVLSGDIHFLFKFRGRMYDTLFCRIALNTAFIPPSNSLMFNKYMVSPDTMKKDNKASE